MSMGLPILSHVLSPNPKGAHTTQRVLILPVSHWWLPSLSHSKELNPGLKRLPEMGRDQPSQLPSSRPRVFCGSVGLGSCPVHSRCHIQWWYYRLGPERPGWVQDILKRGINAASFKKQKPDIYTHRNIGQVDQEIHSAKIACRNIIKQASWEFPQRWNLG